MITQTYNMFVLT